MQRDEIIEMARPAEWLGNVEGWTFNTYQQLEDFAKLVAAKEREACALIAEKYRKRHIDSLTSVFIEVCNSLEEKGVNRDKPGFIIAAAELTSVYFDQVPR